MKTRYGFVSNSSSSSFVVAFKRRPASVDELHKMLFDNNKTFIYYDYLFNTEQAANTVWKDMKGQCSLTLNEISSMIGEGYVEGAPEYPWSECNVTEEQHRRNVDKYEDDTAEFIQKMAKRFVDDNVGAVLLSFSYSDNDGEYYSALEHGGLFQRLPHIRISHH